MAENYFRMQEYIANKIHKAKSNFKKSPKERISLSYLEVRQETLDQHWSVFLSTHRKIVYEIKREELEKSSYTLSDIYDKTEETYMEYKSLLRDALSKLKAESSSTKAESSKSADNVVKLPKISLPKFSGKYSEWVSFRDLFISLIHNNSSIDNVQKLHYLKGSLTGEAELILRHIPVTSSNYLTCWEQLYNRYNNKKYLANSLLKRLMEQKNLVFESSDGIKQLLDVTHECLQGLANLEINVSSWDIIIIYIITNKLDPESRKLWEQRNSESHQELPSYQQFRAFLESRFRSLEFLNPKISKPERKSFSHVAANLVSCVYCNNSHKLYNCKEFAKQAVETRRSFVQNHHLCYNCFSPDHSVYHCKLSTRCHICKKKHHSLLHLDIPKALHSMPEQGSGDESGDDKVVATVAASTSQMQGKSITSTCSSGSSHSQVLLATALVEVQSRDSTPTALKSLIDQGSQASFITESAVQMLGLKRIPETSVISGLGGDQSSNLRSRFMVEVKLQSRVDTGFVITVKCHVLSKLTALLPNKRISINVFPTLPPMVLADPSFGTPSKIDLLLGAEIYSQILLDGLIRNLPGSLIAQNTRLGWILSGTVEGEEYNHSEKCHEVVVNTHLLHQDENEIFKKFWELESEPSFTLTKHLTEEEQRCEELFSQSTARDETGRYIVRLPFKTEDLLSSYGNSLQIARRRFLMLERRFSMKSDLKHEYSEVMNDYISSGHMEKVKPSEHDQFGPVYLPHHAVIREEKSTTKVRVVFDASCKGTNGASLNSDLMIGPTLQPELRHLVMRWRCYPISIVADIVKMYRQVKVAKEDQDYQRVLWRQNPEEPLEHYSLKRVTFGTSSAPYLAVRCLQQAASDEGKEFPQAAARTITDFYMDDLLTGCHSEVEGQVIFNQMSEMLGRTGFELQKWSSSSFSLSSNMKNQQETSSASNVDLKVDEVMKILGLTWNKMNDEFRCTVNLPVLDSPVTKRKVISDIARLFDPLGWLAPTITLAKTFIQRLWLSGISWDDELPVALLTDWLSFRSALNALTQLCIPRWIHNTGSNISFELHGFSDASNVAYAAVVYARIKTQDDKCHVHLITSKTRIAPVKQISVPRLELCGAVLLAKLLSEVAEVLQIPKSSLHAWTDSTIVLAWLSSHPSRWKTFIANRVSEILTTLDGTQWSHVTSKDNPADCASRGILPSELIHNKLWFEGPSWLRNDEILYSKNNLKDTNLEERKPVANCSTTVAEEKEPLFSRFSSLQRLTRVIALCRRVTQWKKPEKENKNKKLVSLSAEELRESLLVCFKLCQSNHFNKEIKNLQNNLKIDKKSSIYSLNPILGSDHVLRVGGRIQNANLSEEMKHPVILPQRSHLTNLLIADAHSKTLHGGPQLMLNYLRSKYWILGAKSLVRLHVRRCVTCARHRASTQQQMMGQLPSARVTAHRPFYRSGVDYAGPINVRCSKGRGQRSEKGYICLFICMATRAIHLECVSDMTSQGFLAAFKRFVARRGHVIEMWSDNGTTFVGAARELRTLFDAEQSSVPTEIADWLASNGTSWRFIPPHSPNFGGLWEAGIKSTKHHLKRVLDNSTLTFEEMTTTLSQIEACLNSRPLGRISTNSEDEATLTPGHFLVGEPLIISPDLRFDNENVSMLRRWQLTQRMVRQFWSRWSHEYLTLLQQRYKWQDPCSEPKIGDVVLIKEDDPPPARWLLGRITDKHVGVDGLTRVVSLKYKNGIIKRPLSKLVILPVVE